jgi:hypothetical protein
MTRATRVRRRVAAFSTGDNNADALITWETINAGHTNTRTSTIDQVRAAIVLQNRSPRARDQSGQPPRRQGATDD